MINYHTDKLIILCYPGGAGGKCLINSLGLSNGAVFQDIDLAIKQINGNFSPLDKLSYLKNQFALCKDHWSDLNLGCIQFFGINNNVYLTKSPIVINPDVEQIINQNLYFFIVAHNINYLKEYLIHWPNAKIILFKNTKDFILSRGNFRNSGVEIPPTSAVKRSIIEFDWEINKFKSDNVIAWWDSSWFLSESSTIENIKHLYSLLGLIDYNEEYIKTFYSLWIDKLEQLKHK
jgi:hypothetical protein